MRFTVSMRAKLAERGPLLVILATALVVAACGALPFAEAGRACTHPTLRAGAVAGLGEPTDPGQPFAGRDVTAMAPAEAERIAREANLDLTWRYSVAIGAGDGGYSECWCVPPPDGTLSGLAYDTAGRLVIFVHSGQRTASVRDQPTEGWGC